MFRLKLLGNITFVTLIYNNNNYNKKRKEIKSVILLTKNKAKKNTHLAVAYKVKKRVK